MKTRIIYTKIWEDSYIEKLTPSEKLLFIYLLTNPKVNIIATYEIRTSQIALDTGLTKSTIEQVLDKFNQDKKFLRINQFIHIVNADKFQTYSGKKNEVAKEKEWLLLPSSMKADIHRILNTPIDTPIDTPSIGSRNQKSEIRSQKLEKRNQKELDLLEIQRYYNDIFLKKLTSLRGFEKNYAYWVEFYSKEDMMKAISNARKDSFWKDKMTLTILFRRKNKNGEDVDYIGDLSSRQGVSELGAGDIAII